MEPNLACQLLILVVAASSFVLGNEYFFPPNNPIQGLESGGSSTTQVQVFNRPRYYEFTDTFGIDGCVQAVTFCYSPRAPLNSNDGIFTVEIRGPNGSTAHPITVNSTNDFRNCPSSILAPTNCCINVTLDQPFAVSGNDHYALRMSSGSGSLLLHNLTYTANGQQFNIQNDGLYPIDGPLPWPYFQFRIATSDTDCSNVSPTQPTEATSTACISVTSSTNEPYPTSTSSYTRPTKVPDSQTSDGGSSNTAPIAGVIVAVLAIIIILTIAVIVVVMCIKRKQKERRVIVSRAGEETGGIPNVVYGVVLEEKLSINTYTDKDGKHQYECIEDLPSKNYEIPASYAEPNDILPPATSIDSYAATGPAEVSPSKRPSQHYEVDSIYEAPANSVTGLYAQLDKIKVATIPRSAVQATECLGSGQFGTVNRGVWQSPSSSTMEVAIKTLNSSAKEMDRVKFLQEGAIMGQFRHPNVVNLYGVVKEEQTVLLVIELLAKTDLREHLLSLRPQEGQVDQSIPHTLLSYCRQVAAGLFYLSKKGFIHRDIAARNILLSEDLETCKIADFGMSRDLADETYYISSGGKIPVKWTAPEALHYKKYSTASDVWSFGCLMYEIWSLGHKPFEGYTNSQAIKVVDGGQRLAPPPGCPRAIYQLMINCWNPTSSERLTTDVLTQSLARSDTVLLKWDPSDKPAGDPLALQLGGPLDSASQLYPDLQRTYLPVNSTDVDYEDPDD